MKFDVCIFDDSTGLFKMILFNQKTFLRKLMFKITRL